MQLRAYVAADMQASARRELEAAQRRSHGAAGSDDLSPTGLLGRLLGRVEQVRAAATSAFGTRHIACEPANTSACTTTCPPMAWRAQLRSWTPVAHVKRRADAWVTATAATIQSEHQLIGRGDAEKYATCELCACDSPQSLTMLTV